MTDSRFVYPLTLHHNGRMGGPHILYAESSQIRNEWKNKLEEALGLRKVVQESNKVFEVEYLSMDTFIMPPMSESAAAGPTSNQDSRFTGKVTCSVPFSELFTGLVHVVVHVLIRLCKTLLMDVLLLRLVVLKVCGLDLDMIQSVSKILVRFSWFTMMNNIVPYLAIRQVLHLKMVTQCAMLENFGIFLVLADKVCFFKNSSRPSMLNMDMKALFAYDVEALVPSSPHGAHTSQVPLKLSGKKDVHFFSVGTLQGRTLIVYMKKKGVCAFLFTILTFS